jgi:protein TonB
MDEERLRERKAARRRSLIACGASLAIHAAFFSLLFAFAPPQPRALPELSIVIGGEAQAVTGPTIAARGGERPASPEAATPGARADKLSLGEAAGHEATAGAAPSQAAPMPVEDASSLTAKGGNAARDEGLGTVSGSAPKPGSAAGPSATGGDFGAGAQGSASSGSSSSIVGRSGDLVAELAARIDAAVEARKVYPEAARRRGTEGSVKLRISVAGDGSLLAAKLAASSGSSLLDRAALDLATEVFPMNNPAGRSLEFQILVRYSLKK